MFTVKAKDEGATPERTDKLTNLFTVEFNLTGIGQILDNVESYIKVKFSFAIKVVYGSYSFYLL